jgi:hypothetical protein
VRTDQAAETMASLDVRDTANVRQALIEYSAIARTQDADEHAGVLIGLIELLRQHGIPDEG